MDALRNFHKPVIMYGAGISGRGAAEVMCLANFEDIGYGNIEEVTQALVAKFPADIPDRSMVQFKIVNCDNGKVYVYEHQKGKGFK